jgi:hypothetical protein
MGNKALLALENGSVYRGQSVGGEGTVEAEICFNTSMTGYQEILTDPSYHGQVVTMTYPHIGNYGINPDDAESKHPQVSGFVMRELSPVVSNFRSRESLSEYLDRYNIPALCRDGHAPPDQGVACGRGLEGIADHGIHGAMKKRSGAPATGRDWSGRITSAEVSCQSPLPLG